MVLVPFTCGYGRSAAARVPWKPGYGSAIPYDAASAAVRITLFNLVPYCCSAETGSWLIATRLSFFRPRGFHSQVADIQHQLNGNRRCTLKFHCCTYGERPYRGSTCPGRFLSPQDRSNEPGL